MDEKVLIDKDQFPTDEIIFSHLGRSKAAWKAVFKHIDSSHPDITGQWKFYNDYKSWLMKASRKSKTIFWLSLIQKTFRITFYFSEKAEAQLAKEKISPGLKKEFARINKYGKFRNITLMMDKKENVELVKELIELKLKVK